MFSMKIWMVMRKSQTLQNFNFYTVFAAMNSYDYFMFVIVFPHISMLY